MAGFGWLWLALAGFARVDSLFHLRTKVFFPLCKHLYFFGAMSRRKTSSYFLREKIENEFHEEESDTRLPNLKPRNFQTKWFNVIVNYALSPAIAYLSLCKGNRGTNCLLRQLSWLKDC